MNDSPPDVLALPLEEAREALRLAGFSFIRERLSTPPRALAPTRQLRVARQRLLEGRLVELVVVESPAQPADRT